MLSRPLPGLGGGCVAERVGERVRRGVFDEDCGPEAVEEGVGPVGASRVSSPWMLNFRMGFFLRFWDWDCWRVDGMEELGREEEVGESSFRSMMGMESMSRSSGPPLEERRMLWIGEEELEGAM